MTIPPGAALSYRGRRGDRVRVLVIDDEPDVLELCRLNLSFEGHEVLEAPDGPQGLECAVRERPDVILLDVMLPHGDGISLLGELKRRRETSRIPVILLTARARLEDQIRGWEAGAALYVTKPFSPGALCEATAKVGATAHHILESERGQMLRRLGAMRSQTEPRP